MKTHKILALLLALMMLVSLMPTLALADDDTPAEEPAADVAAAEEVPASPAEETAEEPAEEAEEAPAAEEAAPAEEPEAETVPAAEEAAEVPATEAEADEASAEPEEELVTDGDSGLSGSGYVLMNIPYAAFYAAEGDADVDAVTSSTLNKTRNSGLAGGSYHQNSDGTDISGVVFPVYVSDLSVLTDCTQITDENTLSITTTNRGTTSTATYSGKDCLFESASYSFYVLTETPAVYKTLTVSGSSFTFGAATGNTQTVSGVTGEVSYYGHTDVQIALTGTNFTGSEAISGVLVTLDNGRQYGLRHVYEIWRGTELGFNLDEGDYGEIVGHTITNITYYTTDCVYSYPVSIEVPGATDAYVLMNIPYDAFYAAEGDSTVDAVTSATKSKPLTGLASGSYHVNADGTDISGVVYPVYVKDISLLENFTQITDEDSVSITVTNRGQTTTTEYTGRDALFQSESYSYYILGADEVPAVYKTLTVNRGSYSFSAAAGNKETVRGVTGEVSYYGHTDVEIALTGTDFTGSETVNGVLLTTDDGAQYGLRHVYNIWRGTELGFNLDESDYGEIVGKTITNITYYTTDCVYSYPVSIEVPGANDAYVLMNIPYAAFYANEGDSTVDAVASATLSKPLTTLAAGSYHENADGSDISGVVYPVYVKDISLLEDFTQITDEDSVSITVTNRGQTTTTEYTGRDALFQSESYSYYVLGEDEVPATYKTLTLNRGNYTFSAATAQAQTVEGVTGTVTLNGRHTDVEISLTGTTGIDSSSVISGVVLTTDDGAQYGLRHVYNIWRGTELGFDLDDSDYGEIAGKTITNIRYYTQEGTIDYPVEITVAECGYVLMNIPYDEFYAAEGDSTVDAVTSSTLNKPRTIGLAGGSYHQNADGSDISGIVFPVFVSDLSVLEGLTQITDESTVSITTTNRGQTVTTDFTGADCLFESATYSYYLLSDAPANYKALTVAEDGSFSFGAASARAATVYDVEGTVTYNGRHTNIEISLDGINYDGSVYVSGVVLTLDDGSQYGLRHVTNIWRGTELGFNLDESDYGEIVGHTITNIRYYTQEGTVDYPVSIPVAPIPEADGWQQIGDDWYYAKDGVMVTDDWVYSGGIYYYMGIDGRMETGSLVTVDGETYYFDENGRMTTGWQQLTVDEKTDWYYFGTDGSMYANRWVRSGSTWYWLSEDGTMAADEFITYRSLSYYLQADGRMATGWQQITVEENTAWYYFNTSGEMLTSQWLRSGRTWYYLDEDGTMAADKFVSYNGSSYYLNVSGAMATGWQQITADEKTDWYYFGTDGAMLTGWQRVGSTWYYLDTESGVMYANGVFETEEGSWSKFDSNGAWIDYAEAPVD